MMVSAIIVVLNSPAAHALGPDYSIEFGLGVETTSVNRGSKSTKLNPSVYGFLGLERGDVYGGIFTTPSSIAGEIRPLLVGYAGYAPSVLGLDFNIGARYYSFPDSSIFEFDLDDDGITDHAGRKGFVEGFSGVSKKFDFGKISARFFYSPNSFAESGKAYYFTGEYKKSLGRGFDARVAFGRSQYAEDHLRDDYWDYRAGIFKTLFGLEMFLQYSNTVGHEGADDSILVFGVEKGWTAASRDKAYGRKYRKIMNGWVVDKAMLSSFGYPDR